MEQLAGGRAFKAARVRERAGWPARMQPQGVSAVGASLNAKYESGISLSFFGRETGLDLYAIPCCVGHLAANLFWPAACTLLSRIPRSLPSAHSAPVPPRRPTQQRRKDVE